jgi:hypothetical protein
VSTPTTVTFDACNGVDFDVMLHILSATDVVVATGASGGCSTANGYGVRLNSTLGVGVYYVVIEGSGANVTQDSGAYTVTMECAPVDDTAAARIQEQPLTCGDAVVGDTSTGVDRGGESAREHVYNFTVATPTTVTFDACNSSYDVFLRVLDAIDATEVVSQDDGGCPTTVDGSRVIMSSFLLPGTYQLVIEGWNASEGLYDVTMTCTTFMGPLACGQTVSGNTSNADTNIVGWSAREVCHCVSSTMYRVQSSPALERTVQLYSAVGTVLNSFHLYVPQGHRGSSSPHPQP